MGHMPVLCQGILAKSISESSVPKTGSLVRIWGVQSLQPRNKLYVKCAERGGSLSLTNTRHEIPGKRTRNWNLSQNLFKKLNWYPVKSFRSRVLKALTIYKVSLTIKASASKHWHPQLHVSRKLSKIILKHWRHLGYGHWEILFASIKRINTKKCPQVRQHKTPSIFDITGWQSSKNTTTKNTWLLRRM